MNSCLEIMPHPYMVHEELHNDLSLFFFQAKVLFRPFHIEEYRLLACDGVLQVLGISDL